MTKQKKRKLQSFLFYSVFSQDQSLNTAFRATVHRRMIPITKKIPSMPLARMGRLISTKSLTLIFILTPHQTRLSSTPAAITEAICPETLTPMVCMSRKF